MVPYHLFPSDPSNRGANRHVKGSGTPSRRTKRGTVEKIERPGIGPHGMIGGVMSQGRNEATDKGMLEGIGEGSKGTESMLLPFPRRVIAPDPRFLSDDILPTGVLLEFVPADILNAFINYVDLRAVITERDPEEDDRYINISNRFYTHFHEFGTVVHVVASSAEHWWYFCYDIDASDCSIGRAARTDCTLDDLVEWARRKRISGRYPVTEIDVAALHGWRSFQ